VVDAGTDSGAGGGSDGGAADAGHADAAAGDAGADASTCASGQLVCGGACDSPTSTSSCAACGNVCDAKSGTPSCNGTTCSYACNSGFADCNANTAPDLDGCETPITTPTNCSQCGTKCDTVTGAPACPSGTTCIYACNQGRQDCNAASAPDTDGCECTGTACCGSACQTAHKSGLTSPATYYDCNATGVSQNQAKSACGSSGGNNCAVSTVCCGAVNAIGLCLGQSDSSVCGAVGGSCYCWQYSGTNQGTVQPIGSGKCAASCGSSGDPQWN
jgi:hypothetical protein